MCSRSRRSGFSYGSLTALGLGLLLSCAAPTVAAAEDGSAIDFLVARHQQRAPCEVAVTCVVQRAFAAVGLDDSAGRQSWTPRAAATPDRAKRPQKSKFALPKATAPRTKVAAPAPRAAESEPTASAQLPAAAKPAEPKKNVVAASAQNTTVVSASSSRGVALKTPPLVAAQLDASNFRLLTAANEASPTTASFIARMRSAPIRKVGTIAAPSREGADARPSGKLAGALLSDRFAPRTAEATSPPTAFVPPTL